MYKLNKEQEILKLLFKDFLNLYNSRSMGKAINTSHAGAFKILKRLEKNKEVAGRRIGKAVVYSLNLDNPVIEKKIDMILTLEAQSYKRWLEEFKDVAVHSLFVVLFGSVIENEKTARDIDLFVVAEEKYSGRISKIIKQKNELSSKNTHLILQTPNDFKKDLKEQKKAVIEIIKKGVVLYGQDKFVKMIK